MLDQRTHPRGSVNPAQASAPLTIRDSSKSTLIVLWFFTLIWCGFSAPLTYQVWKELERKPAAAIGLLFPIVGLGFLVASLHAMARRIKFGASTLELEVSPAVGGRLAGTIRTEKPLVAENVRLSVRCIHRTVSGHGKNRTTRERTIWEDEHLLQGKLQTTPAGGVAIPVSFQLSQDCPATDQQQPRDQIIWRLDARAEVEGPDYFAL